jgi:hypothetical protein
VADDGQRPAARHRAAGQLHCATDQPKAVLQLAYSVLFNEVTQVNRTARVHVASFARAACK